MPVARFQMPDGRVARFQVPEGTTPEQAQQMMEQESHSLTAPVQTQPQPAQKAPTGVSGSWEAPRSGSASAADSLTTGLADIVHGGAQLLTHALPESVVKSGNKFNNWLADKTGLVPAIPQGGVDQMVKERENAYQARRAADGKSGFDGWRLTGNVVAPTSALNGVKAASMIGKLVNSGLSGAASAALIPVTNGDYATEKRNQVATGAMFGGALPLVAGGVGRVISPKASTDSSLQLLRDSGVNPTLGQTLGGRWNAVEEKLQSVPLMGDAISLARGRALEQFNRAAINRATNPIGERVESVGQTGVKEAGDKVSAAYDSTLSRIGGVKFDQQFVNDLGQLRNMTSNLTAPMSTKFDRTLQQVLSGRTSPANGMTADTFKKVDSEIGNLAGKYQKSQVASESELGDAYKQLQSLMRDQMRRSNPSLSGDLRNADAAYANLVRVEGAAKAGKNADGLFTPAQLNGAIQAADNSTRKRAVARGTSLMQDLANSGQKVLGNKVPNSFTADRMLLGGGGLGMYAVNPAIPASLLGGAAMYSPLMQRLLVGSMLSRPQNAKTVARMLNDSTPMLAPASGLLGLDVVK